MKDFSALENPGSSQKVQAIKQMIWEMTERKDSEINRKSQFAKILLDISSSINPEKEFSSDEYIPIVLQRDPEFFERMLSEVKSRYKEERDIR